MPPRPPDEIDYSDPGDPNDIWWTVFITLFVAIASAAILGLSMPWNHPGTWLASFVGASVCFCMIRATLRLLFPEETFAFSRFKRSLPQTLLTGITIAAASLAGLTVTAVGAFKGIDYLPFSKGEKLLTFVLIAIFGLGTGAGLATHLLTRRAAFRRAFPLDDPSSPPPPPPQTTPPGNRPR